MAWQDDREEAWLMEMARQGLHMKTYNGFGGYTFDLGLAREDVYRMDFISLGGKERARYLQLFADAGWTHICGVSGWQYFRKPAGDGGPDEIFSDNTSKIEKYRRVIALYLIIGMIMLINFNTTRAQGGPFFDIVRFLFFLIGIFFTFSLIKIWRRMEALKKRDL
jgi:hypothetical protein